MSARGRKWALGIVGAGIAGALVLIALIGARPDFHDSARPGAPLLSTAGSPPQAPQASVRPLEGRPGPTSARAQARRFLDAFLIYEVRGTTPREQAAFAATANARLRRYLGAFPRRVPRDRKRTRLVSLRLYGLSPDHAKASAIVERERQRSLLEFMLIRSAWRWRVSAVFP